MAMLLHTINQAALVKSTDKSGNSCNMRAGVKKGPNTFVKSDVVGNNIK
jgi:hypothetical protein